MPQVLGRLHLPFHPISCWFSRHNRKKNTVENLREELKSNNVDVSAFDDKSLERMIKRANAKNQYVISLEKIRAGDLAGGKSVPIISRKSNPSKRKR